MGVPGKTVQVCASAAAYTSLSTWCLSLWSRGCMDSQQDQYLVEPQALQTEALPIALPELYWPLQMGYLRFDINHLRALSIRQ